MITPLPKDYFMNRESLPISKDFRVVIKVLAFRRSQSLLRLWDSLLSADYGGRNDVDVEILIDAPRNSNESIEVEEVRKLADSFSWPFGAKKVTQRKSNLGISGQWRNAWIPSKNTEFAFILEDDIEVSPIFFRWTIAAISIYYDSVQMEAHETLFEALINSEDYELKLTEFLKKFAGLPIIYGICLQRQHIDPLRYPRKLNVENSYLPYLYSLIGTWGPLFFPLPWRAFQIWWDRRRNQTPAFEPFIDGSVTNEFYKANSKIWSPWLVRFAFETGLKCLYPNVPGNVSLVTNFREAGENYAQTKGAATTTASMSHIMQDISIMASLSSFPSIEYLSKWQYDLSLRRVGSFGIDRPCYDPSCGIALSAHSSFRRYIDYIDKAVEWTSKQMRYPNLVGSELWTFCVEVLSKYIPPDATVLHTSATPLLFLLPDFVSILHPSVCDHIVGAPFEKNLLRLECNDKKNGTVIVFDFGQSSLPQIMEISQEFLGSTAAATYIFILGACNSSPAEICIETDDCFEFVESVSIESSFDLGGTLFR